VGRERSASACLAAGLGASVVALGLCAATGGAAWRAWLAAAFLGVAVSAGATGMVMTMRLVPGIWAREVSPWLEAEALIFPIGALAIVPVLLMLPAIYPWTHETQATVFRAAWLSRPLFVVCTIAWLGSLGGLAFLLARQPAAPRAVSCIGLILFLVLGTFAATDWMQSLDPAFNSSGFGLYAICLQMLTGFAAALALALADGAPLARPGVMGGLLLTLLLLWAYFAFMPFFIIWSGNAPSGAAWYLRRSRGVWAALAWTTAACRFGPLFLLLFDAVRRSRRWLLALALVVLAGDLPEVAWLVLPAAPGAAPADSVAAGLFLLAALGLDATMWGASRRVASWRESLT